MYCCEGNYLATIGGYFTSYQLRFSENMISQFTKLVSHGLHQDYCNSGLYQDY